jgi:glycosyltransferase involved in cell wall biosynthesis
MNGSLGIVIATYNRPALVRRAVESVLEQDQELDLLVVDDGSDDDVQQALSDLPLVRVVRQPNLGVNAARNRGIVDCRADWVLTFDDDDTLVSGALTSIQVSLSALAEGEKYPVVLFGSSNSRQDEPTDVLRAGHYLERRVGGDLIPVIQREVFLGEGLAYPDTPVGGEQLLWLDVAERYGIPAWDIVIVKKSDDTIARLSSSAAQIERAREHALVQEQTLVQFSELFQQSYPDEYVRRRLGAATYRLLAGDRKTARAHLREAGLPRRDPRGIILTLLSYAPAWLTRRVFIRFRRVHNSM